MCLNALYEHCEVASSDHIQPSLCEKSVLSSATAGLWGLSLGICVCRIFHLRDHRCMIALQIWLLGYCQMARMGICCLKRASRICIQPPGLFSLLLHAVHAKLSHLKNAGMHGPRVDRDINCCGPLLKQVEQKDLGILAAAGEMFGRTGVKPSF